MKRNLLFALSVFALTISGLLVFCESDDNSANQESIETHVTEVSEEHTVAELRK